MKTDLLCFLHLHRNKMNSPGLQSPTVREKLGSSDGAVVSVTVGGFSCYQFRPLRSCWVPTTRASVNASPCDVQSAASSRHIVTVVQDIQVKRNSRKMEEAAATVSLCP